jgi:DNA-binding HxlR family transcriptional regulator
VAGQQEQPGKLAYEHVAAWPQVLHRLGLARRQWDVAIVVNLQHCGLGPAELRRRINRQAAEWEPGRRLSWKVLAERLDWLEDARYLTRREIGRRRTRYWLRPEACRTLAALDAFEAWCDEHEHEMLRVQDLSCRTAWCAGHSDAYVAT